MTHERRVFVDLSEPDLHHLKKVVRLKDGATVIAVDKSSKTEFEAAVCGDKLEILRERPKKTPSGLEVTLCFALCKGKTNDIVCEKATELGVSRIIFWAAKRSQFSELSDAKTTRLKTIAENAAKQSARYDIPEIDFFESVNRLTDLKGTKICCSLGHDTKQLVEIAPFNQPVAIAIGPEGDFTEEEEAILVNSGFQRITLGYTRLKSETAALAALISVNALSKI